MYRKARHLELPALALFTAYLAWLGPVFGDDATPKTNKEALQPFNDLVGSWRAVGEPEGSLQERQRGFWKETVTWGWKFKGDDAWLTVAFGNGKYFRNGELRYLPDKNLYRLTLTTKDKNQLVFDGKLSQRSLTLDRVDGKTQATERLVVSMVQDVRFVYRFETKPKNRTLFTKVYRVGATKEGVAFAVRDRSRDCVVTGGLGTMTVAYQGQTYYVCCTGCRDYFNENPEKCIKEFQARRAKQGDN